MGIRINDTVGIGQASGVVKGCVFVGVRDYPLRVWGKTLVKVEVLANARVALVWIDVLHPTVDVLVYTAHSHGHQRHRPERTSCLALTSQGCSGSDSRVRLRRRQPDPTLTKDTAFSIP